MVNDVERQADLILSGRGSRGLRAVEEQADQILAQRRVPQSTPIKIGMSILGLVLFGVSFYLCYFAWDVGGWHGVVYLLFGLAAFFSGFTVFEAVYKADQKLAEDMASRAQVQAHQVAMDKEMALASVQTETAILQQRLQNMDIREAMRSRPEDYRRAEELRVEQHQTALAGERNRQVAYQVATNYGLDLTTFGQLIISITNTVMSIVTKQTDVKMDLEKASQLAKINNQALAEKLSINQDNVTRVQLEAYELREEKVKRLNKMYDERDDLVSKPYTSANRDKLSRLKAEIRKLEDELDGDRPLLAAPKKETRRSLQRRNSRASNQSEDQNNLR